MPSPDFPASIPMRSGQPIPEKVIVAPFFEGKVQKSTSVVRQWATLADVAACRCCRPGRCTASGLLCLVVVGKVVTPEEGYTLRDDGCVWTGSPAGDVEADAV